MTDAAANGTDFAYKGYTNRGKTSTGGLVSLGDNTELENKYHSANIHADSLYDTLTNEFAEESCAFAALHERDGVVTGLPKPQYVPVNTP